MLTTGRYQRLATSIEDNVTGLTVSFAVYPVPPERIHDEDYPCPSWVRLANGLAEDMPDLVGWRPGRRRFRNDRLYCRLMLAAVLSSEPPRPAEIFTTHYSDELFDFADYLCDEPLVPFRRSPITGQALAGLLTASGSGGGALVGTHIGWDHGLLMVATVPGGMIVGGVAMGVATALERGLHHRLLALIAPDLVLDGEKPSSPLTDDLRLGEQSA
jgi:hypothetical protein